VILTGGATYYDYKPTPRVVEYNEEGYLRDLPQLQVQRRDHGCGYYVNQDGIKVDTDINHTVLSSSRLDIPCCWWQRSD